MEQKRSVEELKQQSDKLKARHPDRIPVVLLYDNTELFLKKERYLIPRSFTTATVRAVIRKHLDASDPKRCLSPEEALFYFVEQPNKTQSLLAPSELMSSIAHKFTHDDGFLYLRIQKEATFGQ